MLKLFKLDENKTEDEVVEDEDDDDDEDDTGDSKPL